MILSILIPTIDERAESFNRLYAEFQRQAEEFPGEVEILFERDNRKLSIGAKRNILYDRAQGKYSVQWDDDDDVCKVYLKTIIPALKSEDPTHIGYLTSCMMNGVQKVSCDSNRFDAWADNKHGYDYVRTIFYKDVIRTDIARKIRSKNISWGEDQIFSRELKQSGLLGKEVFINGIMYYYKWDLRHKK